MFSCTAAQMREFDRYAINTAGIPGLTLMRHAGRQVAVAADKLLQTAHLEQVTVLAGKGNNGGDALIAAAFLDTMGYTVRVYLCAQPDDLCGDASQAYTELPDHLRNTLTQPLQADALTPATLVIDGLLGTGATGEPREPIATWIRQLNDATCPVLAIDSPSGLNTDTGTAGLCVRADLTLTLALPKTGLLIGAGPQQCGRLIVADIGFPAELHAGPSDGLPCFTPREAAAQLTREDFDTFKNQRGHVTVIGGSILFAHAPFLSAEAALRSGAGLASVLLPHACDVLCSVPRALIVRRLEDDASGFLTTAALPQIAAEISRTQAIAFGPGAGCKPDSKPVLEFLLQTDKPLVIDADGLNLLAANPTLLPLHRNAPVLLTPHPGEMRRLQQAFGLPDNDNRIDQALRLAHATGCYVILKGCRSISAAPDGNYFINLSGSPALATAGSGDVLTGIVAALLANGQPPLAAAATAACIHGLTGEILAPLGSRGYIADDIVATIPAALREISPLA